MLDAKQILKQSHQKRWTASGVLFLAEVKPANRINESIRNRLWKSQKDILWFRPRSLLFFEPSSVPHSEANTTTTMHWKSLLFMFFLSCFLPSFTSWCTFIIKDAHYHFLFKVFHQVFLFIFYFWLPGELREEGILLPCGNAWRAWLQAVDVVTDKILRTALWECMWTQLSVRGVRRGLE